VEPLHATAGPALRTILDGQPTTPAKVTFAWQIAAGAALARATTCTWSTDGTLTVRASNESWRREVRRARPLLVARLNSLLGAGVVDRLDIR